MRVGFLGGGTERAGSTWLDACLREHPHVLLPVVKEIHFFSSDSRYAQGVEWYHSFFERSASRPLIGEVSPTYLRAASIAAERIYAYRPDIKLIFILRDPIQRAYSHYVLRLASGTECQAIEDAITTDSQYVRSGLYYSHLLYYLRFFSREQMLILLYDDLVRDPMVVFSEVCAFLNSGVEFIPSVLRQRVHAGKGLPRYPRLAKKLHVMSSYIINNTVYARNVLLYLKRRNVFAPYHRANFTRIPPKLTRYRHDELAKFYRHDVQNLSELLQRDLSGWLQYEESDQLSDGVRQKDPGFSPR
jgi:sulfotransferase family protein